MCVRTYTYICKHTFGYQEGDEHTRGIHTHTHARTHTHTHTHTLSLSLSLTHTHQEGEHTRAATAVAEKMVERIVGIDVPVLMGLRVKMVSGFRV